MTIDELAEAVGVPVRTIRFYISEGLLPGPGARGKAASYGEEHLLRLRLIRLLAERRVPLAEIGARLAPLTLGEVRALLAEEERQSAELERQARVPSPKAYVSALLGQARAARQSAAGAPRWEPPAKTLPPLMCEAPSEPVVESEKWERLELASGVELHVRADAWGRCGDLIRRLLEVARGCRESGK